MKKHHNLFTCLFLFISYLGIQPGLIAQNALDFDGTNDRITASNASALITGGGISMACWVYPTNPSAGWPNFDGFIGFRNETNADFYLLQLSSTTVEARLRNSSGTVFTIASPSLSLNTWNHFVLTYDGTRLRLYKNGVRVDSLAANGFITNSTTPFNVGTIPFGNTNFDLDGRLEDVGLWSRPLSNSEVAALYNACQLGPADSTLKLCYTFNQGVGGGNNASITQVIDCQGNINGTMNGFALTGNTSNFVAHGNPTVSTLNDTAACTYTSPSGMNTWTSTGVYNDTLMNAAGCDSIITINLFINQNANLDTLSPDVCEPYISPSGNQTWTTSGTYSDTLTSSAGCDSVLTIFLTVNQPTSANIVDSACGSYTSPSGNYVWMTTGSYADTLQNRAGCDSVLSIDLTVISLDTTIAQSGATLTSNATNVSYQWLACDNNFGIIPNATNASFTPGVNGNYAVAVSANGCTDTSACINVIVVSAPAPTLFEGLKLYPNPNQGRFAIQSPSPLPDMAIQVKDVTGKVVTFDAVRSTNSLELEVSAPDGLYFVEITSGGLRKVFKISLDR